MPFFEIGGKLFETEYGPITEMDVIDLIDDMTAMYIITKGDFSGFDPNAVDKITQIAHDKFESILNLSLGVGLGLSSLVPGPAGIPVRKGVGVLATGMQWIAGSSSLDAAMRRRVKYEVMRLHAKQQRAIEEGRK